MLRHKHRKGLKVKEEDDLIPKSIIYEDPELNTKIENEITNDLYLLVKTKTSEGTIMNSIWTLISFSPTCTFFFIPFALSFYYMIPGVIIFLLTSLLSYYTLFLFLKVIVEKQAVNHSYSKIIASLLSETQSLIINILVVIYYFGLSIIYVYIGKELMSQVFTQWLQSRIKKGESLKWLISLVLQIVSILLFEIMFAFIKKKHLTKVLHSLILISLIPLSITQIFYVLNSHLAVKSKIKGDIYQIWNISSISTLGLSNHLYYIKGLGDMSLFSQKRGKSLIIWSILGEFLLYLLSNLIFGFNEKINYPSDPILGYFKQMNLFLSQAFFTLIFVFLQFKVSNIWITLLDIFGSFIKKDANENTLAFKYSTKMIYIVLGLFLSNFVAYWFNYNDNNPALILIVTWIVGGLCASVLSFMLPIVLFLKVFPKTSAYVRCFQVFIFFFSLALIALELTSAIKTNVS